MTNLERGRKDTKGKLPYHLLPILAIEEVLKVFQFGANKYGERNWEKGIPYSECYAALCRHLNSWWQGNDFDGESGLSHLAHAAWWALALIWMVKTHPIQDDRPATPPQAILTYINEEDV